MKDLAPEILRQRLLIEGKYTITVTEEVIREYFNELSKELVLRQYGEPIIFAPETGMGKDENAGFDAFVPLIDSGISLYVWSAKRFFSVIIYTCKAFDGEKAREVTKRFFKVEGSDVESMSF